MKLIKIFFLLLTGLFIVYGLAAWCMRMGILYRKRGSVRLYVKYSPFYLSEKTVARVRMVGQFFGIVLLTGFVGYILLNNFAPWGVTVQYATDTDHVNISELEPKNRVEKVTKDGQTVFVQKNDLIYFTTKMPVNFDTATIRLTFQNPDPQQTLSVGFQDQTDWHYHTQQFDAPILNGFSWGKTGSNPVLYQRTKHYASADDFLSHPPQDSLIGTYDYSTDIGSVSDTRLSNYKPAMQETVIDTPLRGKHILYVYVQNEPFHMTIQKQDLNWYNNPDTMTVQVYKGQDLVYQATLQDDGVTNGSRKVIPPQTIDIKNPGPGLPENGVYKVIIDANEDTVIKRITTNLHKIVFQGNVFLAGNHDVYRNIIASTSATILYTNALTLSALTNHTAGEQSIAVGNQTFNLNVLNSSKLFIPAESFSKIIIPKNDLILSGFQGYFAFSPDQFFLPSPYRIVPIAAREQLDLVDYILTDYVQPQRIGDWQTANRTFDLRTATIKDGTLSWVIMAPQLQSNKRQIIIKSIAVTFNKKGWM